MHAIDQPPKALRLNKYLASSLGVSRRQADELIQLGKVEINGKPAQIGDRVTKNDNVTYKGANASPKELQLIILHKPTNYVCSRKRQGKTPTIYDLLPKDLHHLNPVGRLDKDSSGIILLTNDGDFAHQMTHPSFGKVKRYLVTLDKDLEPLHHQMINDRGINLEDGKSQMTLSRQYDDDSRRWIVEISEGRNRQIRRTFSALGYTVTKLHRTNFGPYALGDIKRGDYQSIDIP